MRAIGYFRADSAEDGALAQLQTNFNEYCRLNLHQPVKTFVSAGPPPAGADEEYGRVVDYIRRSGSEFLIVVAGARSLGPDLESVARSIVELDGLGAKVTCSDEDFPDPMQNAFQTLGIKGVSRTRSKRITDTMRARALRGQALGRPPYGYRIGAEGTLVVRREEAAVVELIFRLYTREGLGLRLIAQHLNDREISTRRGGNWNVVSIRDILRNPAYTGTYSRYGMRRPKVHEAIISPDVFRSAQEQTMARRPTGRVARFEPFLLSATVYCGYCGNKMMGVTRRQSWKRKDGRRARGVYRYYQCQSRANQSRCAYHTWRAPLLEGTVLTQLRYLLPAKASPGSGGDGDDETWSERSREAGEERVKHAESRFLRAAKRHARGDLGISGLAGYLSELDAARQSAANVQGPVDLAATLANWEGLGFEERRAFLAQHVTRIVVEDETVRVEV